MESLRSSDPNVTASRFVFYGADGRPAPSPREWEQMLLAVPVSPNEWESSTLHVGDVSFALALRKLDDAPRVIAEWPRSGPGRYRLTLKTASCIESQTVQIDSSKLPPQEFAELLDQLQNELPVSVAIALQKIGGLAGINLVQAREPALAEELARIRRAIKGNERLVGLERILRELGRDPHTHFAEFKVWQHRERARRPAPEAVQRALARPGNIDRTSLPTLLLDTRVQHSYDTHENRLVGSFVRHVDRRLRRVLRALTYRRNVPIEREALALLESLTRSRRAAPFLEELPEPRTSSIRATMVLLRTPIYRAALDSLIAFRRGLRVRLDLPQLDAALENVPTLYEYWCTLQVIGAFLSGCEVTGFQAVETTLFGRINDEVYVRPLIPERPAVIARSRDGHRVAKLIPQRMYPSRRSVPQEPYSISYPQRPDIAIEIWASGRLDRVLIFDPKYKFDRLTDHPEGDSRPQKTDIDKMHAYRDAIRDSAGQTVASYAAIIYPGATEMFGEEIAALGARPCTTRELHTALHQVIARHLGD